MPMQRQQDEDKDRDDKARWDWQIEHAIRVRVSVLSVKTPRGCEGRRRDWSAVISTRCRCPSQQTTEQARHSRLL